MTLSTSFSRKDCPTGGSGRRPVESASRRLSWCVLLFLLLIPCYVAQRNNFVLYPPKDNIRDRVLMLPRGGDNPLLDGVEDALVDVGLKPWIEKHLALLAKAVISSFFVAQILAYLGVIGDKGEGLYEWAVDNDAHSRIRKLGVQPGGFLRVQLEKLLIGFANMPDRAQFVTCVSIGATVFPLLIQTVIVTAKVTIVSFVLAELLAFVGILGDPGEGLGEYLEDSEPMIRSLKRWVHQTRRKLRKKLQLGELFRGVFSSLQKDRVFWAGIGVGAAASIIFDEDKVSQGMANPQP